jgi:hypothetical protein
MSDAALDDHMLVARAELTEFLDRVDVSSYLRTAGVAMAQLARIHARLVDD